MRIAQFLLGTIVVNCAMANKILLSECEGCCEAHVSEVQPAGVTRDANIRRCNLGCFDPDFEDEIICQDEDGLKFCPIGAVLRETGKVTFLKNGVEKTDFCVGGNLDVSFAPTPNPIPPSRVPTRGPSPGVTQDSSDSDETLPIVLGSVGAIFIIGVILMMMLMPTLRDKEKKEKAKQLLEAKSKELKEVEAPPIAMSVAGSRLSLRTIMEDDMLENLRIQFEITYDFFAEGEDEMDVQQGEKVIGITPVNEEWWVVEREATGEVGMVPNGFMKELFPDGQESAAIPKAKIKAKGDDIF